MSFMSFFMNINRIIHIISRVIKYLHARRCVIISFGDFLHAFLSVWILVSLKPRMTPESVIMHSVSVVNLTVILSPLHLFFFFGSDVTF